MVRTGTVRKYTDDLAIAMADDGGDEQNESLDAWALRYRGVATFGALALLLGTGKFVGVHWHKLAFIRRAVVPPAVVSGVLGCVVYRCCKGLMAPGVKSSLDASLSEVCIIVSVAFLYRFRVAIGSFAGMY